jgi:hypothetical protein
VKAFWNLPLAANSSTVAGASSAALELIARLPPDEAGCLYPDRAGKPVCPDPSTTELPKLTRHFGSVKGAWPRIVED